MCTTWLTSARFFISKTLPYLESNASSWLPLSECTGLHFLYKVPLELILVYCTCFIKTVLVFTVSAESLPRRSHTFRRTHTTSTPRPHAPTPVSYEGQTPQIRQLLRDRVDLSIFLKRKKHGRMYLAIAMLIKFVTINIYGSNTEYSFYILYTQNDIKVLQSTEHSNFSLNAACSDFWIHIGAVPKNNSSLCKWNKAQVILIWPRGKEGMKTCFKWSYCWGI